MKTNFRKLWLLEFNPDLGRSGEWQATHEDYDGASDGNNHLYLHDQCLYELIEMIEDTELEYKL